MKESIVVDGTASNGKARLQIDLPASHPPPRSNARLALAAGISCSTATAMPPHTCTSIYLAPSRLCPPLPHCRSADRARRPRRGLGLRDPPAAGRAAASDVGRCRRKRDGHAVRRRRAARGQELRARYSRPPRVGARRVPDALVVRREVEVRGEAGIWVARVDDGRGRSGGGRRRVRRERGREGGTGGRWRCERRLIGGVRQHRRRAPRRRRGARPRTTGRGRTRRRTWVGETA